MGVRLAASNALGCTMTADEKYRCFGDAAQPRQEKHKPMHTPVPLGMCHQVLEDSGYPASE